MKLATWNVNSLKVRLPQVLQWLEYVMYGAGVIGVGVGALAAFHI